MKLIKLKCENCNAILNVDSDEDYIYCSHCGTKILIDDEATSVKRIENAKLKARKENHEQEMKERQDKLEQDKKEKEFLENISPGERFRKGKLSKVVLIFAIISVISIFTVEGFLSTFLSVVQAILLIGAWIMGMGYFKEPFKGLTIIFIVLGFVLIVPVVNTNGSGSYSYKVEKIDWEYLELSEKLPSHDFKKGHIYSDSEERLDIYYIKVSSKEYKEYLNLCKEKGYIIDASKTSFSYTAFNNEGYDLHLFYDEDDKELNITLYAPIKMDEIEWPSVGLATLIPEPVSKFGVIINDDEKNFDVYIGKIKLEQYKIYLNECEKAGYSEERSRTEKYFSAKNNDNVKLTINYEGADVIKISVDKIITEEPKVEKQEENKKTDESKKEEQTNNGLRANFKKAMDDYEAFIDEYVVFLKKMNSNPSDLAILSEYTTYLSKYEKMVESFEKWEDEEMNAAETLYYSQVQWRVSQKLLKASY